MPHFTIASLHDSVLHLNCDLFCRLFYIKHSVWHIGRSGQCMPQNGLPVSQEKRFQVDVHLYGRVKEWSPRPRVYNESSQDVPLRYSDYFEGN